MRRCLLRPAVDVALVAELVLMAIGLPGCGRGTAAPAQAQAAERPAAPAPAAPPSHPVRCAVEMRHVALHVADGVVLEVANLDGEFISRIAGAPPVFDDQQSYTLKLRDADISMSAESLTNLLRQGPLSSPKSSVHDVDVRIDGDVMQVKGKLRKGVDVPFSMKAVVSATPDGLMRLHAESLKTVGVPVKGLLDLVGLKLDDLAKLPPGSGIRAEGDDLLIDATAILPPPATEGRLQRLQIRSGAVQMHMTGGAVLPPRPGTLPVPSAPNYLYFYGGTIRFGKLTMTDADMQLVDADPADPFDFFPARYEKQLVAGYSRNTERHGLKVFMPDYARVSRNGGTLKPPRVP
jgi:hypothetical protein